MQQKLSMPATSKRSAAPTKWLLGMIILTMLGFSIVQIKVVLQMKQTSWELARQTSENLAATMDGDIARNIELYDLSLRAVATSMQIPEVHELSPSIRHLVLFDHAATGEAFRTSQGL